MDTTQIERLLAEMTMEEKVGQMTQADKGSITPGEVADHGIGSVLSGGGGNPDPNTPAGWADMVAAHAEGALGSRLGIPLLYGVDAVHGHNNVREATVFPHGIALGAAGDPDLTRRVAAATGLEMAATGCRWDFAPCVAVSLDPRWGRAYESYGGDPASVGRHGAAAVEGFQGGRGGPDPSAPGAVLACVKHYVGDGAAGWGTARRVPWHDWWDDWGDNWQIDQGDAVMDEEALRRDHLAPYRPAIEAGALTVMASYSSWNGVRMHGHRYLLEDVLRGELGFEGLVVSDWMGIDQLDPDYRTCIVRAVNAGVDMVMVPLQWRRFVDLTLDAVASGDLAVERIDLAVRRILTAKAALGLLDGGGPPLPDLSVVGSAEHRALASEAAARSAVLLRDGGALPVPPGASILVGGDGADDIGLQCGGWTIEWQGARGAITPGTTLLEALRASHGGPVEVLSGGRAPAPADVGILVAAEEPSAEGHGDRADVTLPVDPAAFERMRAACRRLVVVAYAGRAAALPALVDGADAVVMAWHPGSEAGGLAEVLLGRRPFTGRLPQPLPADGTDPLGEAAYPIGHG
ncbi:MAG: glycoside hydrolase family 3 protein [Actinobacteria bacterium]|nr:glycoside hydrolase family 3 protein [Actinomycetota bacterium]